MLGRFLPVVLVGVGFLGVTVAAIVVYPPLGLAVVGAALIWAGIDLRSSE